MALFLAFPQPQKVSMASAGGLHGTRRGLGPGLWGRREARPRGAA